METPRLSCTLLTPPQAARWTSDLALNLARRPDSVVPFRLCPWGVPGPTLQLGLGGGPLLWTGVPVTQGFV